MMQKKLEVRNLRISFRTNNGTVKAVRDISFDLAQGETLAVVGESGSGKSVTARAVMGILAPNAIVENGEIIYDGKDLLKISEEEFHALRGNRLAMIFQDPLSSLNPIVRIGKQLTEAMLLNNKERRREAQTTFNGLMKLLESSISSALIAQGGSESAVRSATGEKIKKFDTFTKACVEMEKSFDAARQACQELIGDVDDMLVSLVKGDVSQIKADLKELVKASEQVHDRYVIPEKDASYEAARAEMMSAIKAYSAAQTTERLQALRDALNNVKSLVEAALTKTEPNFFCIGYLTSFCGEKEPDNADVDALNARARKALDDGFMIDFLGDIAKAIAWSREEALKKRAEALRALEEAAPIYEKDELNQAECTKTADHLSDRIEKAIDRLALTKDNLSYIFRSSMNTAIKRYFTGLVANPREEKRVERDTARYNADKKKGKITNAVVPANLIDLDAVRGSMKKTISDLIELYRAQMEAPAPDYAQQAVEMIDYLKTRASEYAFRLTQGMAKHRAIELMSEVGIPEPRKRYRQYPFEFSGGMRQRIVIAIALSANPDILICDEPTTALDVTIQAQILELINRLKEERKLSVIFITHDLGVVANMADRVAVMYAGKIVEYGTVDDLFYEPAHPYTWALLSSMPDVETTEKISAIPGTPPNMILPPKGDAFAMRNRYAMKIDFEEQPPMFKVSDTHYAATWLLHPDAPKVQPPAIMLERIARMKRMEAEKNG